MSTFPNPKLVEYDPSPRQEPHARVRWWWIVVPALLGVLLIVFVVVLALRNAELQETLRNAERISAQQATDVVNARRILETMSAPETLRVKLSAPEGSLPTAQTVYQRDRGRLVLIASNLAPLTPGHIYQLWLLPARNAPPIPAGTFFPDEAGHASMFMAMPPNIRTSGFAVTVEAGAGSLTPTTKPILTGSTS